MTTQNKLPIRVCNPDGTYIGVLPVSQYGSSNSQPLTPTAQTLQFNEELYPNAGMFTLLPSGELRAERDMNVLVSYSIHMLLDSGDSSRNTIISWLENNGTPLDYSDSAAYSRGLNYDPNAVANCVDTVVSLTAGDLLRVRYQRDDDGQTPSIGNSKTWITIKQI